MTLQNYILSIIFVVAFFLLGCDNQNATKEKTSVPENIVVKEYDLRERCGEYCQEYFIKQYGATGVNKSDGDTTYNNYVNHYSKKLKKCFMLVTSRSVPKSKNDTIMTFEIIIDVHENKTIGDFVRSHKNNFISQCNVLEQICKSETEWRQLIKPYMEE